MFYTVLNLKFQIYLVVKIIYHQKNTSVKLCNIDEKYTSSIVSSKSFRKNTCLCLSGKYSFLWENETYLNMASNYINLHFWKYISLKVIYGYFYIKEKDISFYKYLCAFKVFGSTTKPFCKYPIIKVLIPQME